MMLQHVHLFRGLAMALVVISHAKLVVVWSSPLTLSEEVIQSVIEGADIPFWFIAGYLFQHTLERFRYKRYMMSRLKTVVLPYLVCSIPALLHAYIFRYGVFESVEQLSLLEVSGKVVLSLLTARHLFVPYWFIPTMVFLYSISQLLAMIDRRPWVYWLLPALLVAASFMHLSLHYENVVRDAIQVLPVYLLGMAVSHYGEYSLAVLRRHRVSIFVSGAGFFILGIVTGHPERIMSDSVFSFESGVMDFAYLQKTAFTLVAFELLAQWCSTSNRDSSITNRVLTRIADLSFGIFLVHIYIATYVVEWSLQKFLSIRLEAGLVSVLCLGVFFVVASFLLVECIRRITGRYSRMVIGA